MKTVAQIIEEEKFQRIFMRQKKKRWLLTNKRGEKDAPQHHGHFALPIAEAWHLGFR